MEIKVNDWVRTPRFLNVQIEQIFTTEVEMRRNGFTEPTHFQDELFVICGKSTGLNQMVFAAAHKE